MQKWYNSIPKSLELRLLYVKPLDSSIPTYTNGMSNGVVRQ